MFLLLEHDWRCESICKSLNLLAISRNGLDGHLEIHFAAVRKRLKLAE